MSRRIFRSSFLVSFLVLLASVILIFGFLFQHFEKQLIAELKNEAGYIAYAVEKEGLSYLERLEGGAKRVTVIDPEGKVLADTAAKASDMENHSDRSEVQEALKKGSGSSIRYSITMAEKTVYYAKKMEDGNILRISAVRLTVMSVLLAFVPAIMIVMALAIGLSLFLSGKVAESILQPINGIDLDRPESEDAYEELAPLLSKIAAQKKTIDSQIKEAAWKQEEFRLITENMSEGFLVIDNRAELLTYNKAAVRLLDIEEEQTGSVLVLNRRKGFREVIEKVLAGDRAENDISMEERDYKLIANPVFRDGAVIGAVIVILDITENVKREQLRREFTSNVSHELKTPLTSISGFAEIMKAEETPPAVVMDFADTIYQESQRLITLVNDIIKLSELDEKTTGFEEKAVDLHELSEEALSRLGPLAEKRNITLNLFGGHTVVWGARKILDEMIYNLCDNAIKYNKDGGNVDVLLYEDEAGVKVTVRDTGIGISAPEQQRVFERFYRVDKSHSKAIGGTGLGLAIVKHGAMYHNAEISLKSTLGKGTSVTLTFKKSK